MSTRFQDNGLFLTWGYTRHTQFLVAALGAESGDAASSSGTLPVATKAFDNCALAAFTEL